MNSKKIENIVFYKFNSDYENNNNMKQACIFYSDGSVENTTFENGIEAAKVVAKEEKISNINNFKDIFNSKRIFVLSGREFENRFDEFLVKANEPKEKKPIKVKVRKIGNINELNSPRRVKKANAMPKVVRIPVRVVNNSSKELEKESTDTTYSKKFNGANRNADEIRTATPVEETKEDVTATTYSMKFNGANRNTDEVRTTSPVEETKEDVNTTTSNIKFEESNHNTDEVRTATPVEETKEDVNATTSNIKFEESNHNTDEAIIAAPVEETKEDVNATTSNIKFEESNHNTDEAIIAAPVEQPVEQPVEEKIPSYDPIYTLHEDVEEPNHNIDEVRTTTVEEHEEPVENTTKTNDVNNITYGVHYTEPTNVESSEFNDEYEDFNDFAEKEENKDANDSQKDNESVGFLTRIKNKLIKNKLVRNIILSATMVGILSSCSGCQINKSHSANNSNSSVSSSIDNNSPFANMDFATLLKMCKNQTQFDRMYHMGELLDYYNITFANKFADEEKGVKPALTWDEMFALNLAYNDYSKEEIDAMLNGSELDAIDLGRAYKNATLQLMGAYILETEDMQVQSSAILVNKDEQDFVEKYNRMFLDCKNAKSENEKINLVNKFYQEIYKDFPISDEIREVGLSHSEGRNSLESYKLAVTPIVAASEMLFQNLKIDHTLADKAIAYFNDMGLCNIADNTFEKAAYYSIMSENDMINPTYEDFKNAKIKELTKKDAYTIVDAERDISRLDLFQQIVNGDKNGFFVPGGGSAPSTEITEEIVSTETHTEVETETHTETETTETDNRDEAVEHAGEDAVEEAEKEAEDKVNEENKEEQQQAEQEAEKHEQELQQEEDKHSEEIQEEIKKDDEDLQEDIKDANETIEQGGTVNEDDFGDHNVDFDDEHSNSNGDLDSSVEDLTTDSTGDQTGEPLPDPNDPNFEDMFITAAASDSSTELTNEELVDEYLASLENQEISEDESFHK